MIEQEDNKLYVVCDYCKNKIFWKIKGYSAIEMLGSVPLPEGWTNYNEMNIAKLQVCPKPECQRSIDLLLEKQDKEQPNVKP